MHTTEKNKNLLRWCSRNLKIQKFGNLALFPLEIMKVSFSHDSGQCPRAKMRGKSHWLMPFHFSPSVTLSTSWAAELKNALSITLPALTSDINTTLQTCPQFLRFPPFLHVYKFGEFLNSSSCLPKFRKFFFFFFPSENSSGYVFQRDIWVWMISYHNLWSSPNPRFRTEYIDSHHNSYSTHLKLFIYMSTF